MHTETPRPRSLPGVPVALHHSLVFVWLWTAVVSALNADAVGQHLLAEAGVQALHWQWALIAAGTAWDLALGLWLWLAPSRRSYQWALAGMLGMTALATGLLPQLWWHPLGPLVKNLPMAAILWHGIRTSSVATEGTAR